MSIFEAIFSPPQPEPEKLNILRGEYPVRRLSAKELRHHQKQIDTATKKSDHLKLEELSAQLVLDSLVGDDGKPLSSNSGATVDKLVSAYSPSEISDAVDKVIELNYVGQTGEQDAKKD
ncbi:hypothetical protein [Vibrio sp. SCSIO 43136]|uniref:hypothetical protein n=1 Tax=Vibrio sp. SCSIO 43136 TaxID=2819101 RepID=UPI0020759D8A|nr:hypothetical protein [Vibrio sp. SCSIO 43136]USD68137.1 hypothetical protein J4N39_18355 [Vibrio sp. SCSIO 43136]